MAVAEFRLLLTCAKSGGREVTVTRIVEHAAAESLTGFSAGSPVSPVQLDELNDALLSYLLGVKRVVLAIHRPPIWLLILVNVRLVCNRFDLARLVFAEIPFAVSEPSIK